MPNNTIAIEDKHYIPVFNKIPISIERGEGVFVWEENGRRYIDFTSGWGVTCIGHANPVIVEALSQQSRKIIQNPNGGLTYSPAKSKLLALMADILPDNLPRLFFSNSGAEANDAVIKLARKVSGRQEIIAMDKGFHGRTISTASATGQAQHRAKFNPLMPAYRFVPFNDLEAMASQIDTKVAAVILEPIQGEGGINIPDDGYLKGISELCFEKDVYLIIDEIQTGFCRTGKMFAIDGDDIRVDFLTMAKGIAGGFPFAAFAVSEKVADRLEKGDHGGTYCGNPLGCAVAYAVIKYLIDNDIAAHVTRMGAYFLDRLKKIQQQYPGIITTVRGKGLLIAMVISSQTTAEQIITTGLEQGLILNLTQGNMIRIFPALNIRQEEAEEGLSLLEKTLSRVA